MDTINGGGMAFQTEQENFWAGDFGNEYIKRNKSNELLASNLNYFSKALHAADKIGSVIEFGANVGMNMRALKLLYPSLKQFGVEINKQAATELAVFMEKNAIYNGSIFDFKPTEQYDLSITKGVLIHIEPEMLPVAYEKLYQSSRRYVLVGEYYNPVPMAVDYRGNSEKLFKRDFCGEIMDIYSDLKLIDYGFSYKRDPAFPQDDISWFLMEK